LCRLSRLSPLSLGSDWYSESCGAMAAREAIGDGADVAPAAPDRLVGLLTDADGEDDWLCGLALYGSRPGDEPYGRPDGEAEINGGVPSPA
jgi:hypothetical protein